MRTDEEASVLVKILLTLKGVSGQDFRNRHEDILAVFDRIGEKRGQGYADITAFCLEPGRYPHPPFFSCDYPEFLTDIGRTRFDRIYIKMLRKLLKNVNEMKYYEISDSLYRLGTFFTFCKHNRLTAQITRKLVRKLNAIIYYSEISEDGLYLMLYESSYGDYESYCDSDYSYERRHYEEDYGYTFEDMVDDARMAAKYGM